ncbi:hypothetical protein FJQ98_10875 [Lysinibacillus agricola]|uniref:Cysteine-rich CPCC domain-containing protein n=1 Tax=Lysinibacillus agricola TaxID=2590012 RepID=A0ABX7B3F2_9BACI|nr:hypothetical protein FJQ98_10875 [Lysinibacillus agricola]
MCKICFWEDDRIQFSDPDYRGGANEVSLKQAQQFLSFGACEKEYVKFVRQPNKEDIKDVNWRIY